MHKFLENKAFMISTIALILIILVAAFANLIIPHDPFAIDSHNVLKICSAQHPLGTDEYGRDILSRLIVGLRPSLFISVCATFISMMVGMLLGVIAGYSSKFAEQGIMRLMDLILCFPSMLLALMIVSFWGSNVRNLIITISIVFVPTFARLAYASTLKVKHQEFIEAQISLGASFWRVVFRGILPNIFSSILVQMSLTFGNAILLESGLSFLGLGVTPPTPSLGYMVGEAQGYIGMNPMFLLWPSMLLAVLILTINIFGDGLRDILDPRLHRY